MEFEKSLKIKDSQITSLITEIERLKREMIARKLEEKGGGMATSISAMSAEYGVLQKDTLAANPDSES